jgi:hypothetical protein
MAKVQAETCSVPVWATIHVCFGTLKTFDLSTNTHSGKLT